MSESLLVLLWNWIGTVIFLVIVVVAWLIAWGFMFVVYISLVFCLGQLLRLAGWFLCGVGRGVGWVGRGLVEWVRDW